MRDDGSPAAWSRLRGSIPLLQALTAQWKSTCWREGDFPAAALQPLENDGLQGVLLTLSAHSQRGGT